MNEKENLDVNNKPAEDTTENLDYSFDFSDQVAQEDTPETLEEPKMVDVSVPVLEETPAVPEAPTVPVEPIDVPVMEESPAASETPVAPAEPEMVDVSVPVMEETPAAPETPVAPAAETEKAETKSTEEIKDGKSTVRFGIILGLIIAIFIIALPFILKYLG